MSTKPTHGADLALNIARSEITERIKTAKAKKYPRGVIAIHCANVSHHDERFAFEGDTVRVQSVVSTLDARVKLAKRDEVNWLVLLTDISDAKLGMGITSHLLWSRVVQRQPWLAINAIFSAQSTGIDLLNAGREPNFALELLRALRPIRNPRSVNILNPDHVYQTLAEHYIGLKEKTQDPPFYLAAHPKLAAKYRELELQPDLSENVIHGIRANIAQRVPAWLRKFYTQCLDTGNADAIIVHGLVAEIVAKYGNEHRVSGAFETKVGSPLDARHLLAWATTARSVLRNLSADKRTASVAASILNRADELVSELGATERASASDVLPCGFTVRATKFAYAIEAALKSAGADGVFSGQALAESEDAFRLLEEHELASSDFATTRSTAHYAIRLLRWLSLPRPETKTLDAAVAQYRTELGWVDLAYHHVWSGAEGNPALAAALQQLAKTAEPRRKQFADVFARQLDHATSSNADVPGIEKFIPEIIVPLAVTLRAETRTATANYAISKPRGIALIVIDGMSVSAAASIGLDISNSMKVLGTYQRAGAGPESALAVMPSLTTHSRTSLFSGRITSGGQTDEKRNLASILKNSDLRGSLFHKGDLETSDGGDRLPTSITAALTDDEQDVVACVLNSVDDALDKTGDLSREWDLSNVKYLRALMNAASSARRTIVLVSDHGHVLERRTSERTSAVDITSARSREVSAEPVTDGERKFHGARVVGGHAILAVSDTVRYGHVHTGGYHGGANPAEIVIPVMVYSQFENAMSAAGWVGAPPEGPRWWHDALGTSSTSQSTGHWRPAKPTKTAPVDEAMLFAMPAPEITAATFGTTLVQTELFKAQYSGRIGATLSKDKIIAIVDALVDSPRRRISESTAAQILGVSAGRLPGAISALRSILNYEAYEVVSVDGEVRLDLDMLCDQFKIPRP